MASAQPNRLVGMPPSYRNPNDLSPTRGVAYFDGKPFLFDGIIAHKQVIGGGYEFKVKWLPTWESREKYEKEEDEKKALDLKFALEVGIKIEPQEKKEFHYGENVKLHYGDDVLDARMRPDGGIDLLIDWEPSFVNEKEIKLIDGMLPIVEREYRRLHLLCPIRFQQMMFVRQPKPPKKYPMLKKNGREDDRDWQPGRSFGH